MTPIPLADLISRAKATVVAQEQVKVLKAKAKKAGSGREADAVTSEAAALQATLDWRTVAVAFRTTRWTCTCGESGTRPEGLFFWQEHARLANATRMLRVTGVWDHLPRKVQSVPEAALICPTCAPAQGFPWSPP